MAKKIAKRMGTVDRMKLLYAHTKDHPITREDWSALKLGNESSAEQFIRRLSREDFIKRIGMGTYQWTQSAIEAMQDSGAPGRPQTSHKKKAAVTQPPTKESPMTEVEALPKTPAQELALLEAEELEILAKQQKISARQAEIAERRAQIMVERRQEMVATAQKLLAELDSESLRAIGTQLTAEQLATMGLVRPTN